MQPADLTPFAEQVTAFQARFAPYFYRAEVRERSARYLEALLSPVRRKNGWQLAEAMGEPDPNGPQRLLYAARWDADAVRDELHRFVMEHFGDPVAGILIIDETGFLKKGTHSVGVARQYSGTAGKIENCQLGVFLAYASPRGHTFLDRRLYLPAHWAADEARRSAAGVPTDVTFQTKPQLARTMLAQARTNGVVAGWVVGDEQYGNDGSLRRWLDRQRQASVLGVRATTQVWVIEAERRWVGTVAEVAAGLAAEAWQRLSVGDGAKGPRLYDWTWVPVAGLVLAGWGHWLLVRRSISEPSEVAYYLVGAPVGTTLAEAASVAGARWRIEQVLEEGKGEVGLDEYEVRSWTSWHRHITLSMLAHACLAWIRSTGGSADPVGGKSGWQRRVDRAVGARAAPAAGVGAGAATAGGGALPSGLVGLATAPPSTGAGQSLPPHRRPRIPAGDQPHYVRL